jgi:hypothetical protein
MTPYLRVSDLESSHYAKTSLLLSIFVRTAHSLVFWQGG